MTENKTVVAYKGFDKDLKCRDYQFAIGETFKHEGQVKACASGFHACEHPLNVFSYYAPSDSRFCEVILSGDMDRKGDDTKIASAEITIKAELKIPELISRAIKYVFDRVTYEEGSQATGYQGAASATGDQGAAMSSGFEGKAQGAAGNALFLVERLADFSDDHGKIIAVWAGIVGQDGIEPDTFYTLKDGKPVKA